jgi:hypothetical protein
MAEEHLSVNVGDVTTVKLGSLKTILKNCPDRLNSNYGGCINALLKFVI